MGQANQVDEIQKGVVDELIKAECYLLNENNKACLRVIMELIQDLYGDINKDTDSRQTTGI